MKNTYRTSIKWIMIAFLLLVMVNSCKKEKVEGFRTDPIIPPPSDTLLVNDTFLTYWYFPVGSWWVYKRTDTIAEIYDTATVINNLEEIVYNRFFPFAWERYGLNIEHTHFRSRFDGSKANQFIDISDGLIDRVSSTSNAKAFSYTYFFSWPIDSISILNKSIGSGGNSYLIDTNKIQLPIGEIGNIVHLEYRGSRASEFIWLSKDIGKVKFKSADNNTVWELINYNINK